MHRSFDFELSERTYFKLVPLFQICSSKCLCQCCGTKCIYVYENLHHILALVSTLAWVQCNRSNCMGSVLQFSCFQLIAFGLEAFGLASGQKVGQEAFGAKNLRRLRMKKLSGKNPSGRKDHEY